MSEIILNVEQKSGVININFDEIKEQLATSMEEYRGMIFTEDSKTEAKKTVASLRKLKKAVNNRRIEVKKTYMQPYTDFELKVKELDKLIDEPINFINGQVKEFDKKRVAERKREIDIIYEECIGDYREYLPLLRIYDYKWENASTSKKVIREEIEECVRTVTHDIETIKDMQTDAVDKALGKYKATLCLADAITFVNNWEKQKAEIVKRQEEAAAKKKVEESVQAVTTPPVKEKFVEPKTTDDVIVYEIRADLFQKAQLEAFMKEHDIEYRRV